LKKFDLLKDVDLSAELGEREYDVIAIDPPFTPMPQALDGYDHSSTRNITGAALRAAVGRVKPGGMIAMLTYAFGDESSCVPATLQKIFDSIDLSEFEEPIVTPIYGPVWRVQGRKQMPLNPMPVRYMSVRYLDNDWHHQFESKGVGLADYVMWIENEFIKKGRSHLHYVSVVLHRR